MSYGQLFPNGTVPSAAIALGGLGRPVEQPALPAARGFQFTSRSPGGACYGATYKDARRAAPLYGERIEDGWYQLPGRHRLLRRRRRQLREHRRAAVAFIDSACGPIGKAVYDAAHIADPEIDYSDYDTDKDGVVDFFMMVFVGDGGNGASQLSVPPYDNIWPHSCEPRARTTRTRPTGLKGYISDDQLKDLEGRPLYYTDAVAVDDDDDADRVPGLRPRRPVQRQPRVGDRQGERHLARVRPLARAAGLLLEPGQRPRDLRRLDADGDRQVAEHGRRSASRSSAGSSRAS